MYYLGIDVGKKGGFAFFKENGEIEKLIPMPMIGSEYKLTHISNIFQFHPIKHAVIEDVHAIFGSSAKATFSFGFGKGILIAFAAAFEVPYTLVTPKLWQKEMWDSSSIVSKPTKRLLKSGFYARKTDTKKTSLLAATRLFPKESFLVTERSSVPHEGVIDAALMGEYCRRKFR